MTTQGPITPFYLMANPQELNPGTPPSARKEKLSPEEFGKEIAKLERAIEATKKIIAESKAKKADVSDFEFHLKTLEHTLEDEKRKFKG